MRISVLIFPLTLALGACAQTPREAASAQADAAATRQKLGRELAGLTPSGTTDCLDNFGTKSLRTYGSTLVYQVNQNLKYVTDTGGGCEAAANGDILVTVSPTGRLCRGDFARTVQSGSRMQTGSCVIGSFTIYKKVK